MKINDIDLYNLPLWLNGVAEKLEEGCQEELKKESDLYKTERYGKSSNVPFRREAYVRITAIVENNIILCS